VSASPPVYVLDSFALLAYLEGEPGMARVQAILAQCARGESIACVPLVNLGEVLYISERERGLAWAQQVLAAIEQLPIRVLPASREAVLAAAHIKAQFPLAYADAFAVVAARERGGILITGDPEFKAVEEIVQIEWLPT
jgi:predicted nucleic acid-binding protein